jgi:hypothetical protein
VLGRDLSEVSGLALTKDGRLLTHEDETGRVFEVDYRRGVLIKEFSLGSPMVRADFEGLTVVDDTLFLLASNGMLYEFQEGDNGDHVAFAEHDTGLKHACARRVRSGIPSSSTAGCSPTAVATARRD